MSCNTGKCNLSGYTPHHYSPRSPIIYVKKGFKSSVPRRLKRKGLDLAFDQCYNDYVMIKRELPDEDNLIIIDIDSCICRKRCEYKCICITCKNKKSRCKRRR